MFFYSGIREFYIPMTKGNKSLINLNYSKYFSMCSKDTFFLSWGYRKLIDGTFLKVN